MQSSEKWTISAVSADRTNIPPCLPAAKGDEGADTKQAESESMTLETKTYILTFVCPVLSQV